MTFASLCVACWATRRGRNVDRAVETVSFIYFLKNGRVISTFVEFREVFLLYSTSQMAKGLPITFNYFIFAVLLVQKKIILT